MGAACSTETIEHDTSSLNMGEAEEAERVSRAIDKQLRSDEKEAAKQVKLLLLGAGESGKTTVLKQMKIIHMNGFSPGEMEAYKHQIFENLCEAMRQCLLAMEEWEIPFQDIQNEEYREMFNQNWPLLIGEQPFPLDYLQPLRSMWQDHGLQTVLTRSNEAPIPENMTYFHESLDRLFRKDFKPTHQDVLRARGKTVGIVETAFISKERIYRLFDVGGQRSERKKWIHCFEEVTAVIFLAAMSGYDQCLMEDADSNVMHEALMLFDSISNSKWFTKTSMILFLVCFPWLEDKIWKSDVKKFFPEYKGNSTDVTEVQNFFKKGFLSLNRSKDKEIYVHYTCAIDTKALKVVMASVTDITISSNLQEMLF